MTKPPSSIAVAGSSGKMRRSPSRPDALIPPSGALAGIGDPAVRSSLDAIRAELLALIGVEAGDAGILTVVEEPRPGLLLRATGLLSRDAGSGDYVFTEVGDPPASIFATPNEERMLDHIVALLSIQAASLTPRTLWYAIEMLVGQPAIRVERSIILATMRYCSGDLMRAAAVLGFSVDDLAQKLARIRTGDTILREQSA